MQRRGKFGELLNDTGVEVRHRRFEAEHGSNLEKSEQTEESWQLMASYLREKFN